MWRISYVNKLFFFKRCNFERRLHLCNRSNFKMKNIWDRSDFSILNKKIQIGVKLATYCVAALGICTNILVVIVIFSKKAEDIFKDYKHYTYLGLISLFCIIISAIELLAWISECFYPYDVFCPPVHQAIAAQLFKMLFKECVVTALRFSCNFCYVAFAINRIALIGKEHGPLVRFIADVTMWKYVVVTMSIGISFSWIKYFKYALNYDRQELSFPKSNELDIFTDSIHKSAILDFYFVFSCISDLINYVVFVIASVIIDVCMVLKLKSIFREGIECLKTITTDEQHIDSKNSEFEDALGQSARMVVLNTAVGFLFKLPSAFLPLINTSAQFFYKDFNARFDNPGFDRFYVMLMETNMYALMQDIAQLLYLVSLSIHLFIYNRFDKRFKRAFSKVF